MIPNLKDHSCAILLMEQPVPPDAWPIFFGFFIGKMAINHRIYENFGDPIFRLKFTGASMLLSSINLVNLRTKILCSSSHVVLHTVTRNSLCLVCLICVICLALAAALKVKRSKDKKKATTTLVVFLSRKQWMECHGDSSGSLPFPFLSAFPFQYVSGQPEVDGVAFGHPPRPSASGRAVESRTRADGGPGSGHCSQADSWPKMATEKWRK